MKLVQTGTLLVLALVTLVSCGGGGGVQQIPDASRLHPGNAQPPGTSVTAASYEFSPRGGTYALPLPADYAGTITFGANRAPQGARMQLDVAGPAIAAAGKMPFTSTTTQDPFPIVIGIQLPFTITIGVPGFTINFPPRLAITGTFDVDWFDPTQPENPPGNPRLLGTAVASGHTLTFTPPPNETLTLVAGVHYTLSVLRDVSNAYPGGAASVVLPVQSGVQDELATVGGLGAGAIYQTSSNTGFLQWQTINGSPAGVPPFIFNDNPIESVVVSATQNLTLLNPTITGEFTASSAAAARRILATAATPAPGAFVPDPSPTVVGPFPATVNGNQIQFTANVPGGFSLGGNRAWSFSIVTVTVCVPTTVTIPCDDGTTQNLRASVPVNTQFDVLVADESGLLTQAYSMTGSGACTTNGVNQNDNNGDNPPGYNDNPTGPKSEFEVLSGSSPGTCQIVVSYNGNQVAQTSIAVDSGGFAAARIRYTLRPPVNGPTGLGVSGKIP